MKRVRKQIEVPDTWTDEVRRNVTVAVLDTGIAKHPDLVGKIIVFRDFVGNEHGMYDDNGHGTHVCGIICGSGRLSGGDYAGIAPNTRLVVGKVLDETGEGKAESMLEALDWILNIQKMNNIRILNISVGIGSPDNLEKEKALQNKLEQIWDSGILVVCAAGNKGPGNSSISSICAGEKAITVGCHDGSYFRDNPKRCERYSGRGKAFSTLRKPDLVAPGTDIMSCNADYHKFSDSYKSPYIAKSGTSMATPIVAGAAALALQKDPMLSNEELKHKLTMTATDLNEPWNKQGWGMVNVRRLLK